MADGVVVQQHALAMASATFAMAGLTWACDSTVVIGSCAEPTHADAGDAGAPNSAGEDAVGVPWSTGFEDGLCGYYAYRGYCYARHGATFQVVRSPVHSGKFAAAFSVTGDTTTIERSQARCVRQGVMPKSASYSAWYYIPSLAVSDGNWNLFHFLGGVSEGDSHPLWDVSLANSPDGALQLSVFNFLKSTHPPISGVPAIPIGSWFQLTVKILRSAQANGAVTVYQDGVEALHLSNLVTDDTEWGQWYVGNYAKTLVPAMSTVYVDDVTIREEP